LFQQAIIISQLYMAMMVMSTFLVCTSHGSNDVGNAISPLIAIMSLEEDTNEYTPFILGSLGIAFGLLLMGQKVMATIGEKVIILDYMKGFAAQFCTAVCVVLGSSLGIPLSTTHCVVGALLGVFLCGKLHTTKMVYNKYPNEATFRKSSNLQNET
jgi:PiT family inorganic phosphate transporter